MTFGAGSGAVLGTRADRGGIALVLRTHMNKVLSINELNQTAVVQPGMMGPDFEAALNNAPATVRDQARATPAGIFPSRFEISHRSAAGS